MALNSLVVIEIKDGQIRKSSLEVVSEARRQADKANGKVIALIMGSGVDSQKEIPGHYGADQVLTVDHNQLKNYLPDVFKEVVVQAAQKVDANVILLSATTFGQDLAPRIAAKLEAGIASDCLQIEIADGKMEADRPFYAGKIISRVSVKSNIKMATLRPNIFPIQKPDTSRSASVEALDMPDVSPRYQLKEFKATDSAKIDVSEADIIITGGRGMKDPANFKMLEELADLLTGTVGATRAVVDAGWRPHSDQVGQTGKTVSPTLYMMCGASGAIQHWAGMSGSKFIVAVNKDSEAPIIEKADYTWATFLRSYLPLSKKSRKLEVNKLRGVHAYPDA